MKLILINGPSKSGKDTAFGIIYKYFTVRWTIFHDKFSAPHKRAFAALMDAPYESYTHSVVGYETEKDKPIPLLDNASYRQWQIDFSEIFMKPCYGEDIFARLFLAKRQHRMSEPGLISVVSDCGFQIEYDTIAGEWPSEDLLLLQLSRPGFTFEGDSREYVDPFKVDNFCKIENDGDLDDFATHIVNAVIPFVGDHPYDKAKA